MGGNSSSSYKTYPDEKTYRFSEVDDYALNYVLQDNRHLLSHTSQDAIHFAMEKVSEQLGRTMRNCRLTIQLPEVTLTVISGGGEYKVEVYRVGGNNFRWNYTHKGFVQSAYDIAKSVGSSVVGFLASLVPAAITGAAKAAIGWY